MSEGIVEKGTSGFHDCESSHYPPDLACRDYLVGAYGRCVYCDHEEKCHPGPLVAPRTDEI